jgi:hypothetical protein
MRFCISAALLSFALQLGCGGEPQPVKFCGKIHKADETLVECKKSHYTSIEALKELKNLENLDVSGTKVSRLDPLAASLTLKTLNLENTQVDGLSKLKELKNITYLNVSRTNLRNLDGVQELEKLMTLSASWIPGKTLKPVASLKHLVELEIDGWGQKKGLDLTPLHDLKSLRKVVLYMSGATKTDIDELKRLNPNLQVSGCAGDGEKPCM